MRFKEVQLVEKRWKSLDALYRVKADSVRSKKLTRLEGIFKRITDCYLRRSVVVTVHRAS